MSFDPWTLGFQAVNVLVLVWLLHRFFWKPVAAMIADRQARAAGLLQDAAAKRTEADEALAEVTSLRKDIAAERDAILTAARQEADAARAVSVAQARAEIDALNETAKAARVRAAEVLKKTAMGDAQNLAITIAGQLAARLDGPSIDATFQGWLMAGLSDLPTTDRAALARAELEVVSAREQDSAAQERIAAAISQVLGAPASLTFRADPALISGLELHSPHFSLRNSWRADLARIAAVLGNRGIGVSDAA